MRGPSKNALESDTKSVCMVVYVTRNPESNMVQSVFGRADL